MSSNGFNTHPSSTHGKNPIRHVSSRRKSREQCYQDEDLFEKEEGGGVTEKVSLRADNEYIED
jgi:hypothetical protein